MIQNNRLEMIEEMLESNPTDTFLLYAAAIEYKKIGKNKDAISLLKKIVKDDPEYLASYYQLGRLLEDKGMVDKAIVIYKAGKEVAEKANDSKTMGELSEALMLLDVYDEEL